MPAAFVSVSQLRSKLISVSDDSSPSFGLVSASASVSRLRASEDHLRRVDQLTIPLVDELEL